jgi:hypothetical protein
MAAADQQFLDALKYLGQQGQQYGIKQQMNEVNDRAQEIQNTMKDEVQKRAALRNLAQTASISVAGSGGSAQDAAAINNLIPPIPTSVHAAYLQGSMTGDRQMVQVAQKMAAEDQARAIELAEKKAAIELRLSDKKADQLFARDAMKSGREEAEKLREAIRSGKDLGVALLDTQKAYKAGTYVGTGPLDQFTNRLTDQGNVIRNKFAQLGMMEKLHVAKLAGAKAADTGAEQDAILKSIANDGNWEGANDSIITDKYSKVDAANYKNEAALYSLERSNYMSATAYAREYRRKGDRTAVKDAPQNSQVKSLFNKSRGGR